MRFRPRLTLRWLMLLIAVVAIGVWVWRMMKLQEGYWHEAQRHAILAASSEAKKEDRLTDYHTHLKLKYERAARYPWLPLEPDPPEPE